MEYVLELKGISKAFPGVRALDNVHFNLKPGCVHALCGENGAGKSTLIKIINGIYKMDQGDIFYKGERIIPQNPKQMLDLGVATIHQELSPILDMTIAENIFLGREPLNKINLIDVRKLYRDTQKLLDDYGFKYNSHTTMRNLSISDLALIEIVKAVSRDASVVIMDEPTSSITESETMLLFEKIRQLKAQGISVIYISHKIDEIFEICDEVTIFRDGKWVFNCPIKDIDKNGIIEKMVGREIREQFPKEDVEIGDSIFEIRELDGWRFHNVSLNVRRGEIVGVAGLVGAGRSELFRAVFGLEEIKSGEMFLEGKQLRIRESKDAIEAGILMTSEDRKREGVVLCLSVRENIILSSLKEIMEYGLLNFRKEKSNVNEMIEKLSIKISSQNDLVSSLSGGNQQKVVLAKWLLKSPKVLILDEPTRGIDVGAKYEIYKLMCVLAKQGVSIIMISSELLELIGMSDRIVVMSRGKLTGEMNRSEFSQKRIMEFAIRGFENEQSKAE
ncbi:ribose import ATP-binding protein RbsA [Treponema primitia ZAS-2]|uniref:Ribose import ATP-binding protein RbsA n=1 Tax=Treponema primitia (strain ATCC BAA-887 / DSM 12427 / ZAS-2) TaxID=545694 RepID=F5YPH9_TREPZ|nr:sugar ABC transporter ATP-binding protein [Treponema primitia]AEF85806.1 ribose import ATP-binding protein RbsA [Treponema primitia ZAS-2]